MKKENGVYNLYHSPVSSLLRTSSSCHCKIDKIIVNRGAQGDGWKLLTTTLKYHNPNNVFHKERYRILNTILGATSCIR
jgi:hypothetical protein